MLEESRLRRALPPIGPAIPVFVLGIIALTIALIAARTLGLSRAETGTWILLLYAFPTVPALVLSVRYRQPLFLTGNVFSAIFIVSLGGRFSYAEIAGASLVAGAIVLVAGAVGLTGRLAGWIPAPIVHGLIAGAVLPFVWRLFTALGEGPAVVGAALVAFLLSQRLLGSRVPPIVPAVVASLAVAGATGAFGPAPPLALPDLVLRTPRFSLAAVATVAPVFVALITVQANVPSFIYLRSQGFRPPERVADVVSGAGTLVGSLFGPVAVSLSVVVMPLTAGPGAGNLPERYRSVFFPGAAFILIGVLAGTAAEVAAFVPETVLLALAGLALIAVLSGALEQITRGPLALGPLFAFAIALSQISLWGFGPFFWALVLGTGASLVLETKGWRRLRDESRGLEADETA